METQLPLFHQDSEKKISVSDLVKIVSPGTTIRNAIDDVVHARLGALIVLYADKLMDIIEGGFKINTRLTQQRIVELCKMDAAIIISSDRKRILFANTLLVPDKSILTNETGTRHKAAERTAKQAETLTIAVSERRGTVTLYYKNLRYTLKKTEELISRATESLQILEKHREIYDNLFSSLNVLEVLNLVTLTDVTNFLKRIETMKKISDKIERYTIELGSEGVMIRMRLKELIFNLEEIEKEVLRDYSPANVLKLQSKIDELSFDELVDLKKIAKIISNLNLEDKIVPRGHRFLKRMSLKDDKIKRLIREFLNLDEILNADEERLNRVFMDERETESFIKQRDDLKQKLLS